MHTWPMSHSDAMANRALLHEAGASDTSGGSGLLYEGWEHHFRFLDLY